MKQKLQVGDKVTLISIPEGKERKSQFPGMELVLEQTYKIIQFQGWETYDPGYSYGIDIGCGWWYPRKHFISYPDEIDRPTKITRKLKEIVKKTKGKP